MTNDFDNLDEFKDLIEEVKAAGEVPEPSPLFWNHLSARVREAVDTEPVPVSWWQTWRPLVAIAGAVGVVIVAVLLRPAAPAVSSVAPEATAASVALSDESEAMFDMIATLAPSMTAADDVDAGIEPGRGATQDAIDSLTAAERRELVKLLRAEMGISE